MNRIRDLARRIPGLAATYRQARNVGHILHEGWLADRIKVMDQIHLRQTWDFAVPAEQDRHRRILEALRRQLGTTVWGDALEIGSAEGLFTMQLAACCRTVAAWDISPVACDRARVRCRDARNVQIEVRDVMRGDLSADYDLVFAMDCLEYVHGRGSLRQVISKLIGSLRPGGFFVYCGCRLPAPVRFAWWARWFREGADNLAADLVENFGLRLAHQEVHPPESGSLPGYLDHLILLLQKPDGERS